MLIAPYPIPNLPPPSMISCSYFISSSSTLKMPRSRNNRLPKGQLPLFQCLKDPTPQVIRLDRPRWSGGKLKVPGVSYRSRLQLLMGLWMINAFWLTLFSRTDLLRSFKALSQVSHALFSHSMDKRYLKLWHRIPSQS